jgi:putative transposase
MARRLRIEFEGAIYHVMARGNGRQRIVHDDEDRQRLLEALRRAAERCGWEVLAFVFLSTHFHLLIRTPRPNLGRGMQQFLSSYALWYGRRRQRVGHVFRGRYRAEPIEDESYYWTVSRYLHLNPVRAGLVERPADWRWSSYPGYARASARLPWVAYDVLLSAWRGDPGGADAARAYRRFVEEGVKSPPPSPSREAVGGWVLGSERFLARLRELAGPLTSDPPLPGAGLLRGGRDPEAILEAVCRHYGIDRSVLASRGDPHIARAVAAWLCRRHSEAPLRELAPLLGLSRADSVPNLTRRIDARLRTEPRLAAELQRIMDGMRPGTRNKARRHTVR